MLLKEARSIVEAYAETYPEKMLILGGGYEFSDALLFELIDITYIRTMSENI